MGCWNSTCGISQLPIHHRDPIVVFILKHYPDRKKILDGMCYATDLCEPMFLGVEGFYDDYGSIDDDYEKSGYAEIMTDWFNKSLADKSLFVDEYEIKRKSEDNKLHGIQEDIKSRFDTIKKFDTFCDVFRAIERGRLTYGPEYPHGGRAALTYMMVKKDVLDDLLEGFIRDENLDRANAYREEIREVEYSRHVKNDANLLMDWFYALGVKFRSSKLGGFGMYFETTNWGRMSHHTDTPLGCFVPEYRGNCVGAELSGPDASHMYEFQRLLHDLYEADKIPSNDSLRHTICDKMVQYVMLSKALRKLRKMWMPQSGAGSQESDINIHREFAKVLIKAVERREQQMKEFENA